MNLPFHIARRYLFVKKSTNAVNWITAISSVGVLVGTAAMIIVLSAFAGLDTLVRGFYNSFDPDIKIVPAEGKFAAWTEAEDSLLHSFDYTSTVSFVVEDKALFRFREREFIGIVKGVDSMFTRVTNVESHIVLGRFLKATDENAAVFGVGVADYLGVRSLQTMSPVHAYVPRQGSVDRLNPMGNVRFKPMYPAGTFQIQPEFDTKYVFASNEFARGLFGLNANEISGVEIKLPEGIEADDVKSELAEAFGEAWIVKDRDDLQVAIFKVLKSEGLITYLVLTFILLIASFGILSSVNILILEKKRDLYTLWSMGASERLLRRIFMAEGLLISLGGAFVGLALGVIIVLLQEHVGLLSMGQGYVVEYYPVELRLQDLLQVILTILIVGVSISWLAVRRLKVDKLSLN